MDSNSLHPFINSVRCSPTDAQKTYPRDTCMYLISTFYRHLKDLPKRYLHLPDIYGPTDAQRTYLRDTCTFLQTRKGLTNETPART